MSDNLIYKSLAGLMVLAAFALFSCDEKESGGVSVSDVLVSAEYLDCSAGYKLKRYNFSEAEWDYKKSPFQTGHNTDNRDWK